MPSRATRERRMKINPISQHSAPVDAIHESKVKKSKFLSHGKLFY
jgi:hypothetical protein